MDRLKALQAADVETIILGEDCVSNRQSYTTRLVEAMRVCPSDMVHLNVWERREWILAALSKLKVPALCTEHNSQRPIRVRDVLGLNRQPFSWYKQILQALRFPIPAISISDRSLANLRRRTLGLVKSVRIYNGVPTPAVLPDPQTRVEKRVVWAGSMINRKRPLLAIEAIERAAALCPGISLVMMGDGPLLRETRQRAESVRSAKIDFRGNTPNVLEEMVSGDVFLQTSSDEGISYAVLEAMSRGLPVVATDVGATAEAVVDGDTGYLIGATDSADRIARRLVSLFENRDVAASMRTAGFKRCAAIFSLDRMLRETLQTYSEIAGRESVPRHSRVNAGAL